MRAKNVSFISYLTQLTQYLVKRSDGAAARDTEPVYFVSRGREQRVAMPGLLRVNIGPGLGNQED